MNDKTTDMPILGEKLQLINGQLHFGEEPGAASLYLGTTVIGEDGFSVRKLDLAGLQACYSLIRNDILTGMASGRIPAINHRVTVSSTLLREELDHNGADDGLDDLAGRYGDIYGIDRAGGHPDLLRITAYDEEAGTVTLMSGCANQIARAAYSDYLAGKLGLGENLRFEDSTLYLGEGPDAPYISLTTAAGGEEDHDVEKLDLKGLQAFYSLIRANLADFTEYGYISIDYDRVLNELSYGGNDKNGIDYIANRIRRSSKVYGRDGIFMKNGSGITLPLLSYIGYVPYANSQPHRVMFTSWCINALATKMITGGRDPRCGSWR